jgi:pimeloyl-ACP methyl ester carboxylesterase
MNKKPWGFGMNKALGQNWILLRGLARESGHWGDFVPLLQSAFPNARITLLDLPGTGCFYQEKSPSSIKAITGSVRRHALDSGLLQQPVTILALSLGAMVAWEWMHRYPEDICGAVLMNTSFADVSPFYQRLRWQSYTDFIALATTRNLHKRESGILQLTSNRRNISRDGVYAENLSGTGSAISRDGVYDASQSGTGAAQRKQITHAWEKIQTERPISLKNSVRQMIAAASYRAGGTKPRQPVLLLNGLGDRLVAPACSESIHEKWRLPLRRHLWAGHDLTLDDGAWVILQLKDWLDQKSFIHHEDTKDTKK